MFCTRYERLRVRAALFLNEPWNPSLHGFSFWPLTKILFVLRCLISNPLITRDEYVKPFWKIPIVMILEAPGKREFACFATLVDGLG